MKQFQSIALSILIIASFSCSKIDEKESNPVINENTVKERVICIERYYRSDYDHREKKEVLYKDTLVDKIRYSRFDGTSWLETSTSVIYYSNDSIISYSFDPGTTNYDDNNCSRKCIFKMDDNNKLSWNMTMEKSDNTWNPSYKSESGYMEDNLVKKESFSYNKFTQSWITLSKTEYQYNGRSLVSVIDYISTYGNPYTEDKKIEYYYVNDTLKEEILYLKNTGAWASFSKTIYSYFNNKISGTEEYKHPLNSDLTPSESWELNRYSTYKYNENGNLKEYATFSGGGQGSCCSKNTLLEKVTYTYEPGKENWSYLESFIF